MSDEIDEHGPKPSVSLLAERAFTAQERVRMLEVSNVPQDYDERKKAFVALAVAREAAQHATGALERAIRLNT